MSSPFSVPELSKTALSRERLDEVVHALKRCISNPPMRSLSQRVFQAKVWHLEPCVAALLSQLRQDEEVVRQAILKTTSKLVYGFHQHTLDTTLARAGIQHDDRVHAGSSLQPPTTRACARSMDILCLDAKERLYLLLKQNGWLPDFFRLYPLHFYENSFTFVDRIPDKKLQVRVKVVGLGIGGSMAVSGLARHGATVVGYEQRAEKGSRSVTSRYQNASWRAYDIAQNLVDDDCYNVLMHNRQQINVAYDDGSNGVITSDRVQIIIGSAIQSALDSARRYGAELHFGSKDIDDDVNEPRWDIVAMFCGAHTSEVVPGLRHHLRIHTWSPELDSTCKMWLTLQPSDKTSAYCTRGGEIGAETWHYTIESARTFVEDLQRIVDNVDAQYQYNLQRLDKGQDVIGAVGAAAPVDKDALTADYQERRGRLESLLDARRQDPDFRYDYIFTNAPANEHNLAKRKVAPNVVLDGEYTVQVQMATQSTVVLGRRGVSNSNDDVEDDDEDSTLLLLNRLNSDLIVCGGDACVPPNPLAAYGATLACEAAGTLTQLAIGIGHLNSILEDLEKGTIDTTYNNEDDDKEQRKEQEDWTRTVLHLKALLSLHYEARARAENYFQFVQTLICNMYSLPAFYET